MTRLDRICGVDEAGRGPWAGPVMAGAVILDPDRPIPGLTDSKKLSEARRQYFELEIKTKALSWAIGVATPEEIDERNIREATFLAMQRAIAGLTLQPTQIRVDGNAIPSDLPAPAVAIIKGDLKEPSISAASILAKTARDRDLQACETRYPGYGFARHKGYGTKAHSDALSRLGPCKIHRKSFAPVRAYLV